MTARSISVMHVVASCLLVEFCLAPAMHALLATVSGFGMSSG